MVCSTLLLAMSTIMESHFENLEGEVRKSFFLVKRTSFRPGSSHSHNFHTLKEMPQRKNHVPWWKGKGVHSQLASFFYNE